MKLVPREGGWSVGDLEVGRRVAFRLRTGRWCQHVGWVTAGVVDGHRKLRRCMSCDTTRVNCR